MRMSLSSLKGLMICPDLKGPLLSLAKPDSFHPVSNIPLLGKIVRRCSHSKDSGLKQITWTHFGCNSGEEVRLSEHWTNSSSGGSRMGVVYLSFLSAAFDTISHGIPLNHLWIGGGKHSTVLVLLLPLGSGLVSLDRRKEIQPYCMECHRAHPFLPSCWISTWGEKGMIHVEYQHETIGWSYPMVWSEMSSVGWWYPLLYFHPKPPEFCHGLPVSVPEAVQAWMGHNRLQFN